MASSPNTCSLPLKASPPSASRDLGSTGVADDTFLASLPTLLTAPLSKIKKSTGLYDESSEPSSLAAEMGKEGTVLYIVRRPG